MSIASDPFLAPRGDPEVILSKVRQQLFHHQGAGRQNVIDFEGAFLSWDGDRDHGDRDHGDRDHGNRDQMLTHFEFERALAKCGIFLPSQEVNALFRKFSASGVEERVSCQSFLSALRVPLNKRRLAVVEEAFRSFGKPPGGGAGEDGDSFPLAEALSRMTPEQHPEVLAGRLSAEQVKEDFKEFFTRRAGGAGAETGAGAGEGGGVGISPKAFKEYYEEVGVCEPYDAVFIPMVEGVWRVKEPHPASDEIARVSALLRPKLRQRSHQAETDAEVFKKTVKYYGDRAPGMVTLDGTQKALGLYGVYPDRRQLQKLFQSLGGPEAGPIEQDKLVQGLCPMESTSTNLF